METAKLELNCPSWSAISSLTRASDIPAEAAEARLTLVSLADGSEAWSEEEVFFSLQTLLFQSKDLR